MFFCRCTVCSKRFTKSHHLKAHMNTHERNLPAAANKGPCAVPVAIAYGDVLSSLLNSTISTSDNKGSSLMFADVANDNTTIDLDDNEYDDVINADDDDCTFDVLLQ